MLLAAAMLAVAFVPMVLAYLQLGYHGDLDTTSDSESPIRDAERTLGLALQDAVEGIPDRHPWPDRDAAVTAVRNRLEPDLAALNRSAVTTGTAYGVTYNASRATRWRRGHCPDGPDRRFGSCLADRGVVVQDRAGETHVLAAAFDIRVTTPAGTWQASVVVRVGR